MPRPFPFSRFDENDAPILPVLVYHAQKRDFLEEQFQWIKDSGFNPVHLNAVVNYFANPTSVPRPPKTIVLTFDDAYQDFLVSAIPLLASETFDFKATLCVPTGDIPAQESGRQPPPKWTEGKGPLMTWDEIRWLKELKTGQGDELIEFIPHSVTHRYYDELEKLDSPENEFLRETRDSKERLSRELGIEIDSIKFYCLPGGIGWGKESVERILAQNYIGALRAQYESGEKWSQYCIPRCEPNSKDNLAKLLSNDRFRCH